VREDEGGDGAVVFLHEAGVLGEEPLDDIGVDPVGALDACAIWVEGLICETATRVEEPEEELRGAAAGGVAGTIRREDGEAVVRGADALGIWDGRARARTGGEVLAGEEGFDGAVVAWVVVAVEGGEGEAAGGDGGEGLVDVGGCVG
jgi:hypothetical protein